jgi:hypothetical protein
MKCSSVVFREPVRTLTSDQSAPSFSVSAAGRDGGYALDAVGLGVLCSHPKAPGVVRLVAWSNVRWADVEPEKKRKGVEEITGSGLLGA